jgi:hypothetical protein
MRGHKTTGACGREHCWEHRWDGERNCGSDPRSRPASLPSSTLDAKHAGRIPT